MAKITISIDSSLGTRDWISPDFNDAQFDRFLDYIWDVYPQWVDPSDPDQGLLPKVLANQAAAYDDWAESIWESMKNQVKRHEQNAAAESAKGGVGDMTPI
jgi:hypothetical protein